MSVTFRIESPSTNLLWETTCSCREATGETYPTFELALAAIANGMAVACGDEFCAQFPTNVDMVDSTESVDVSSLNAREILASLGVVTIDGEEDLVGVLPADDFQGRVLLAAGLSVGDPGAPATTEGVMRYSGRAEGYLDARYADLLELAVAAQQQESRVIWS